MKINVGDIVKIASRDSIFPRFNKHWIIQELIRKETALVVLEIRKFWMYEMTVLVPVKVLTGDKQIVVIDVVSYLSDYAFTIIKEEKASENR